MIYTELTNQALRFAYQAHHGQLDFAGVPMIFHPLHLAEQMDDELSCCVALLHDIVEDTAYTLENLRKAFPEEVVCAIALLTHGPEAEYDNDAYFAYIRAIASNPVAVKVKLADIAHNCDESRAAGCGLSEEEKAFWQQKYQKAIEILSK